MSSASNTVHPPVLVSDIEDEIRYYTEILDRLYATQQDTNKPHDAAAIADEIRMNEIILDHLEREHMFLTDMKAHFGYE